MIHKPRWTGLFPGMAGTIFQSMVSNWLPSSWERGRCYSGLPSSGLDWNYSKCGPWSMALCKIPHGSETNTGIQRTSSEHFFRNLTLLKHPSGIQVGLLLSYFLRFQFASDSFFIVFFKKH